MTPEQIMSRAIDLALKAQYRTDPNPLVGAVLTNSHGQILSEGYHLQPGCEHAEVVALRGYSTVPDDSTLYVTLEPCSYYGKTPPCVELLIRKKVQNVVVGCLDPNPLVSGKGIQILKEHGINVMVGVCEQSCLALNPVFNKHIVSKLPYVVIKAASSLDGKIAMPSGESKWITAPQTREFSAQLRSRYQAIMIGSKTLLEDNPRLTNRFGENVRQPVRVVMSSSGELPLTASFFADDGVRKIVLTGCQITELQLKKIKDAGITVFVAKTKQPAIPWTLKKLYRERICSILVEGGGTLISSFLKAKMVDKLYLFQSGKLIANPQAASWSGDLGTEKLKNTLIFKFQKVELIGEDIFITAIPKPK